MMDPNQDPNSTWRTSGLEMSRAAPVHDTQYAQMEPDFGVLDLSIPKKQAAEVKHETPNSAHSPEPQPQNLSTPVTESGPLYHLVPEQAPKIKMESPNSRFLEPEPTNFGIPILLNRNLPKPQPIRTPINDCSSIPSSTVVTMTHPNIPLLTTTNVMTVPQVATVHPQVVRTSENVPNFHPPTIVPYPIPTPYVSPNMYQIPTSPLGGGYINMPQNSPEPQSSCETSSNSTLSPPQTHIIHPPMFPVLSDSTPLYIPETPLQSQGKKLTRPFKAIVISDQDEDYEKYRRRIVSQQQNRKKTRRFQKTSTQDTSSQSSKSDGTVKDEVYMEKRRKNNLAAKRSRDLRRKKEDDLAIRTAFLEKQNAILKFQVQCLQNGTGYHMLPNSYMAKI